MLSVGNRIRSKQSVRKSVPGGTFDSSPVRSAGNCVKRYVRPVGTIERPALVCIQLREDKQPSIVPTGRACLLYHFPALRTGLLSNVPPGHKRAFRKRKRSIRALGLNDRAQSSRVPEGG
jgi:hypothetical protein